MSSRSVLAAMLLGAPLVMGAAACSPVTSTHGFQVVEAKPADVKIGEDTKSTVMERLGSPSVVSTFEPNVWFYVSQTMQKKAFYKPKTTDRSVVAVTFDEASEKVTSVNQYDLGDGKQIAFNDRETPTRGRELSILEQLLGNVGRVGNVLGDREENQPGGRRRD